MRNPWLAKNPFLSMWLSGAHQVFGTMRGHAMAEAQRQANKMMAESTRQMVAFWSGAAGTTKSKRRRKTSR